MNTWTTSSLQTLAKNLAKKFQKQYFICFFEGEFKIRQKAVGELLWVVEPNGNIWS